jgi:small subunit ribosomal protein S5
MPRNARGAKRGGKKEKPEFEQKLLDLARVTRVVKGGRRFRFRATLAIGDRNGRVGLGVAKGADVSGAITKAYTQAKKDIVAVQMSGNTITHDILAHFGSAKVMLKPAGEGRGLIAGGAVRAIVELSGIRDIVSKSLGSSNKINVAKATLVALSGLRKAKRRTVTTEKEAVVEEAVPVEAPVKPKAAGTKPATTTARKSR